MPSARCHCQNSDPFALLGSCHPGRGESTSCAGHFGIVLLDVFPLQDHTTGTVTFEGILCFCLFHLYFTRMPVRLRTQGDLAKIEAKIKTQHNKNSAYDYKSTYFHDKTI